MLKLLCKILYYANMAFVGMNVGILLMGLKLGNTGVVLSSLISIGLNAYAANLFNRLAND